MSELPSEEDVIMWLTTMQLQTQWYERALGLLKTNAHRPGYFILFMPTPVLTGEQVAGWGKVAGVRVRRASGKDIPPGSVAISLN